MTDTQVMEKQHRKGKLYVTERLALLFDGGVWHEITAPETRDGVIVCDGLVSGKPVVAAAQDFTYKGGTLGLAHGQNIARGLDLAMKKRCPFLAINDSGGARIQEGIDALAGYGKLFYRNTKASGYIPQLSVILGPCAGGAVYSPGITDLIFVVDGISQMFITGPKVIKAVTGQSVSADELGGAEVHSTKSGVAHVRCADEPSCFEALRRLIALLPSSSRRKRLHIAPDAAPRPFHFALPDSPRRGYDIRALIAEVFDPDSFFELQAEFAPSVVIGLASLGGQTVGLIANQPLRMAGVLNCDSSDKAARFVRFCDAFGIPIVTFTDVPGYLPGASQESMGIIRHGAKLLYAFSEATVPKINIILRKAFGGAYIAMNSKHIGCDYVYALRTSEIAVMGEDGAVEILFAKEAAALPEEERKAFLAEKAAAYRQKTMNPTLGLERGYIDELIELGDIRAKLMERLPRCGRRGFVRTLRKKHGNIPL